MEKLVRVRQALPLDGYRCRITFEDGTQKEVDLKPYLRGPTFETILKDPAVFRSIQVVEGSIAWENGADIDPDVLYYDLKPAWMEEPITR
jgi:hypothetical protein